MKGLGLPTAGAIRDMRRALALDPLSPLISMQLGVMFWYARQYDSAVTQYRRTRELDSPTTRLPPALSRTEGRAEPRGADQCPPLRRATLESPAYLSMTRTTPSACCGRTGPTQ